MGKARIVIALALVALLAGCAYPANNVHTTQTEQKAPAQLVVCCGAGLMKPMNELVSSFEKETGCKVTIHYGGSGELYAILSTKGCDVFIPGSYYYVERAVEEGYIVNGSVVNVTKHVPVIAVPKGNPAGIHSLSDLAKPGVRVAIGDPKACAIGRVAVKMLKKDGLWEKVKKNVVVEAPTVNQLLVYVATGQVDCAIIWADLVTWAQAKGKIEVISIPPQQNLIKTIPVAITVYAKKDGRLGYAEKFEKFVTSPEAIEVWKKWGFEPAGVSP